MNGIFEFTSWVGFMKLEKSDNCQSFLIIFFYEDLSNEIKRKTKYFPLKFCEFFLLLRWREKNCFMQLFNWSVWDYFKFKKKLIFAQVLYEFQKKQCIDLVDFSIGFEPQFILKLLLTSQLPIPTGSCPLHNYSW